MHTMKVHNLNIIVVHCWHLSSIFAFEWPLAKPPAMPNTNSTSLPLCRSSSPFQNHLFLNSTKWLSTPSWAILYLLGHSHPSRAILNTIRLASFMNSPKKATATSKYGCGQAGKMTTVTSDTPLPLFWPTLSIKMALFENVSDMSPTCHEISVLFPVGKLSKNVFVSNTRHIFSLSHVLKPCRLEPSHNYTPCIPCHACPCYFIVLPYNFFYLYNTLPEITNQEPPHLTHNTTNITHNTKNIFFMKNPYIAQSWPLVKKLVLV